MCCCIGRTLSSVLASLMQPFRCPWFRFSSKRRYAINYKHSTILVVRSAVPLVNPSAATIFSRNTSLSIHVVVKEDESHSVSRGDRDAYTYDPDNAHRVNAKVDVNVNANFIDDSAFRFSLVLRRLLPLSCSTISTFTPTVPILELASLVPKSYEA
jgi:hypothetical protein